MRPARFAVASAVALALTLAVPARAAAPVAALLAMRAALSYAALPGEVRTFIELANRHRVALGLAPLAWDTEAAEVARAHSLDMVTRGYFAHRDPDGRASAQRLTAASIEWHMAGENIATGYFDADEVFEAWLASPGHRANLENPGFTRHGVGFYQGRWTHVFYAP